MQSLSVCWSHWYHVMSRHTMLSSGVCFEECFLSRLLLLHFRHRCYSPCGVFSFLSFFFCDQRRIMGNPKEMPSGPQRSNLLCLSWPRSSPPLLLPFLLLLKPSSQSVKQFILNWGLVDSEGVRYSLRWRWLLSHWLGLPPLHASTCIQAFTFLKEAMNSGWPMREGLSSLSLPAP